MAEVIQYTGMKNLDDEQKRLLDKISTEHYEKIKQMLHNETSISVHLKTYHNTGSRRKYSIHVKAAAPTRAFVSTKAADWDFAKTLHMAFKDLEMAIKKGLKQDGSNIKFTKKETSLYPSLSKLSFANIVTLCGP